MAKSFVECLDDLSKSRTDRTIVRVTVVSGQCTVHADVLRAIAALASVPTVPALAPAVLPSAQQRQISEQMAKAGHMLESDWIPWRMPMPSQRVKIAAGGTEYGGTEGRISPLWKMLAASSFGDAGKNRQCAALAAIGADAAELAGVQLRPEYVRQPGSEETGLPYVTADVGNMTITVRDAENSVTRTVTVKPRTTTESRVAYMAAAAVAEMCDIAPDAGWLGQNHNPLVTVLTVLLGGQVVVNRYVDKLARDAAETIETERVKRPDLDKLVGVAQDLILDIRGVGLDTRDHDVLESGKVTTRADPEILVTAARMLAKDEKAAIGTKDLDTSYVCGLNAGTSKLLAELYRNHLVRVLGIPERVPIVRLSHEGELAPEHLADALVRSEPGIVIVLSYTEFESGGKMHKSSHVFVANVLAGKKITIYETLAREGTVVRAVHDRLTKLEWDVDVHTGPQGMVDWKDGTTTMAGPPCDQCGYISACTAAWLSVGIEPVDTSELLNVCPLMPSTELWAVMRMIMENIGVL